MDAAVHADHGEHSHPTWQTYTKIALVLFALTALEVWAYTIVDHHSPASVAAALEPVIVPVLLILSAIKFALVAMFYMHLKSDGKLLTGIFGFSLGLAAVIIVALILIFGYLYQVHPTANPLK
ncbi:MAG: cytochrome C oxidase subunit IV family protein [Gemmatimonadales bacterium]